MSRRGVPNTLLYSTGRQRKELTNTPIAAVPTLTLADLREKLSDQEEEKGNYLQVSNVETMPCPGDLKTTTFPSLDIKGKIVKRCFNPPRRSDTIGRSGDIDISEVKYWVKPKISERALEETRQTSSNEGKVECLNSKDRDVDISKASLDKLNISKKSLGDAKRRMEELLMGNKADLSNTPFTGFSTAGGGKVKISEKALREAEKMFESVPYETDYANSSEVQLKGFCTAAGGQGKISEVALKNATEKITSLSDKMEVTEMHTTKCYGFSSVADGKGSKKALTDNAKIESLPNIVHKAQLNGYSTTTGGKVISEKVFRDTKERFKSSPNKMDAVLVNKVLFDGFSTAAGGKVKISEKALREAKEKFDSSQDNISVSGFSTASGEQINISEKATRDPKDTFETIPDKIGASNIDKIPFIGNIDTNKNNKVPFRGFSTAAGGKVNISAEALRNAREKFDETDTSNVKTPQSGGFSSADRGTVRISAEALRNDREKFDESDSSNVKVTPFSGFSTAAGEKVKISEMALNSAKRKFESLNPIEKGGFEAPASTVGFSTVGGSKIKVSTKALENAQNLFENSDAGNRKTSTKPTYDDFQDDDFDDDSDKDLINIAESSERQYFNEQKKPMTSHPFKKNEILDQAMTCGPFMFDKPQETFQDSAGTAFRAPYVPAKANNAAKRPRDNDLDVLSLFGKRIKIDDGNEEILYSIEKSVIDCRQIAREKQLALIESKKRKKVRPIIGVLLRAQLESKNRLNLRKSCRELIERTVRSNVVAVNAENAADFVFNGYDYFSNEAVEHNANGVALGDGAVVILGDNGDVGCEELQNALLAMPGVDPKLIPFGWIRNHYRWIVWKLASMERRMQGMALTPANVMLQLKLRYDRELDRAERPIIRKVAEKDEPPSTCMVLCVSSVKDGSMEVTDGWYSLKCKVEQGSRLHRLIQACKLVVGTKIVTAGAEMEGGEQGYHPLEAVGKLKLVLHINSTRRVKWWVKLGPAPPFTVRLDSLVAGGGPTPFLKLVVARTYPRMYYVKDQDGKSSYMTERNWNRMEKSNKSVEEIYHQVEKEMCGGETKGRRVTKAMIKGMECGKELLELLESALDPDIDLSPSQREAVHKAREEKGRMIQEEVGRRIKEKAGTAIPLVRLRLVGWGEDGRTGLLTVWRPGEMGELFVEGGILGVVGLTVARVEGKVTHLASTRMTRFSDNGRDSSDRELDISRRIAPFQEMADPTFGPLFNECDIIGFVVSLGEASKGFQAVTLCDLNFYCVRLMVWGGVSGMGFGEVLTQGQVVACRDLEWRYAANGRLPELYVREYSTITTNPKDPSILTQVNNLKSKTGKDFLTSAIAADRRDSRFSPNAQRSRILNTRTYDTAPCNRTTAISTSTVASAWNLNADVVQFQSLRNQKRVAKLDAVAGPDLDVGHLSPSQILLPQYKPPRVTR